MIHSHHTMHENSIAAFRSLDRQTKHRRIMAIYAEKRIPLTDRDVMDALGVTDPNGARPRITELVAAGKLMEVGKVSDSTTGRPVRVCSLANPFQATIGDIL